MRLRLAISTEQRHAIETALWAALRALEESASLYRRMADRAEDSSYAATAGQFRDRAANTNANADTLGDFLLRVNKTEEEERFAAEEV